MRKKQDETRHYHTRFDRFRVRENISLVRWATEAGIPRTQLNTYRSGTEHPLSTTLAKMVRAASRMLRRPVRASELYSLGEDEPVASSRPALRSNALTRKAYGSRFDRLLLRLDVPVTALANESGLSRQAIRHLRMDLVVPVVPTVRLIVRALRRMGHDIDASDIVDVGEE